MEKVKKVWVSSISTANTQKSSYQSEDIKDGTLHAKFWYFREMTDS